MPADFFPPDMPDGALFYVEAFNRLVADRPLSLGFGAVRYSRIPFTSIERYAARAGLNGADEFALFDRVIGAVDAKDIETVNEKANKKTS